ncbi:uncharacterized protein LOC125957848 isoform X1 [Anopheles darlingi]|uniref:uncharacterized protein LOC125957848 isoform X1 n=1 Tax=Anopheles darlingi TaxID=43151 RepID=UPI0021004728|nr:uncharacterized protein LOC125957848 isoform X1 [Anopheles darlingi]XP_049546800.1 uncharacterized protein LOC125957848 isoform X1 [Anopheles darlingi]XP_049546801.1 uncharacterized protein LOC125957848 isoform X1 [Anopheles darlingi]XP_049546802.1 uncharacterized protein LOC125957848 isoform X1 [Anopheles darlingi]XP_049546803.1 uncharacterized protein LOC125957848 isoform X1 [Anopheles darlingi]
MSMQALNSQTSQRRSSLLERYQPKTGSQDPMSTSASLDVHASPSITKSTSQRSLQHSSLLQRYQPKPLGSAGGTGGGSNVGAAPNAQLPNRSSSQRSLDQSKLLKRYYHQPNSLDENQPPAGGQDGARLGDALSANANDQQRYSSQRSLENSKLLQRYNPTVNNSQEFTGLSVRESTPVARFNRGTSLEPERVQRSSLLSKYTPRFGKSLDRNQALEAAKGYGAGYGSEQHLPHQPASERPVQSLASSRTEIADYGADHFDYYRDIRSRSSSLSRGGLAGRKGVASGRGSQRKLPEPTEPVTQETLPMVSAVAEPVLGNIASALPLPMVSVVPPTPAPVQQQQQPLDASSKSPFDGKTLSVTSNQSAGVQPAPAITGPPVKPIRKDLQSGGKGPVAPAAGATLGASGIPGAAGPTANIVSIAIPTITTILAAPSVKQSVSSEPPKEPSPPLFSTRDRMDHYGSASNPDPVRASNHNLHHPQRPTTTTSQTTTNTLQLPGISDMSSRRSMTDLRNLPPTPTTKNTLANDNLDDLTEFTDRAELRKLATQRHQHPVKHGLADAFEQLAAFTIPQAIEGDDMEERIEALPPDRKLKRRDFTYHPTFVPKQNVTPATGATLTVPGTTAGPSLLDSRRSTASTQSSKQAENEEKRRQAAEEKRKRDEERRQREADKRAHDDQERQRKEEEKRRKEEEKRARDEEDRLRKEDERRLKEEEKRVKEDEKRRERDEKKRLKDEKKKTAAALKAAGKGGAPGSSTATNDAAIADTTEEEMIDLASHLDHYSVAATMQTQQLQQAQQRSTSLGRPRSGGTPYGSQGALGSSARGLSNSYQSLDRGTSGVASVNRSQSKLLQRYGPRAGSQEAISSSLGSGAGTGTGSGSAKEHHRSQGSLDFRRSNRPSLLDKYTPRPLSASTAVAAGGQQQQQQQQPMVGADPRTRSTSQRSLDSARLERSSLLQRYKPTGGDAPRRDPYEHRDHEYEPIGEPVPGSRLQPADGQQRKLSNSSFLRVPAGDEGDTVSMEELQKSIEDRFFNQPSSDAEAAGGVSSVPATGEGVEGATTGAATDEPKASKMKAAMAKAQSSGKQAMAKAQESGKQAMAKAQEGGKTLQKKLMQQTDRFKTKMSNIKLKKDGKDTAAPLASPEVVTTPELEKLDFTLAVPKDEVEQPEAEVASAAATAESPEVVAAEEEQDGATADASAKSGSKFAKLKNIHMPKIQKPDFKRPDFSKISKPKMPKLRGPDMSKFKRPEMPKFLTEKPDFGKMSEKMKLTRSKSMKEPSPSAATSAASPSDVSTLGPVDDAGGRPATKINYTDFSTYPRLFDKFKRQKSAPSGQASVRAGTPPPLEFTKTAKTTRGQGPTLVSRWTSEKSSEDAGSSRFLQYTGSELDDRETSVERRMRQELERAEFEGPELVAVTEEQKQLEEYDKENREIHLLSAARHDEFMKRKPPMERQESDLASEEEKQFWASALGQKIRQNIDMNSNDLDLLDEEERLLVAKENDEIDQEVREQAQYLLELSRQRAEKEHERRSSTPYTNQECQSSGSSSVRRRKGVLEEIDDDEFFLRQKGISKDNIQMGEYISSAIKEGLSHPKNALADMDRYDYYDEDADGLRRYYQPSFESDDVSNRQDFTDSYRTFPPDRPNRKAKGKAAATGYDEENDLDRIETEEQDDELAYYDRQRRTKYGSEQPQLLQSVATRYMDDEFEDDASLRREAGAMLAGSVVPPTPPSRRRKKRFRDVTPSDVDSFANAGGFTAVGKSISNNFIAGSLPTNVTVHRAEVPLAREESFGTIPEPAPRRSRSRSQLGSKILSNDDDMDRVSRGAESLIGGIIDAAPGARGSYPYEVSENNGYATVRKEAPPRPPAPIRRRKSTRSLDAAPPLRQFNTLPSYNYSVSPVRPQRNYSTINPNRPPRRKSVSSLTGSQQQLKPTTTQKNRDDVGQYEDVLEGPVPPQRPPPPAIQRDVANKMKDRPLPPPPRPSRKPRRPDGTDRHDLDGGAERVVSVDAEEVDTSTQTDPVSEDFGLDAEIAAVTEQAAAAAAAAATSNRLADTEQLEGALHRFRDGNTKALSDRPKSSRSGSRPETPASILIERKVSTPSLAHESVVEASLTVQPLEEFDDDQYIAELVKKYVSDEARKPEPRRTVDERRLRKSTSSLGREEEIRPVETLGTSLRTPTIRSTSRTSVDGRLSAATPEPLRNVEISPTVIEEIVERLRTTEQHHIDELHKLHQQQLEDLRQQHEAQKRLQEQRLEEQQRQLLEQQSQQLHETQQLKEQILQQQEHQKMLLAQQQNQQQQLLVAQQQQQLLMEQQEKERELQREKERELLREREQELERARERERELHLARELELQRAREVEQQRARDLEQQRIREMELQRAREQEHQRLRELEIQRAIEAEQGRQRELELQQRAAQAAASAAAAAAASQVVAKETEAAAPRNETSNDAQQQPAVEEKQQQAAEVSVDVVDGVAIATATELPPAAATATGSAAPPVRPPLPTLPQYAFHPDYLAYGIPPAAASPYLLRPSSVPSEEDGMTPLAPQRRRRHLRSKRESTSEDDQHQQREQQQRRHRHSTRSPEPSIPSLGGQLVRACGNSLRQTGDDLMAMLRASSKDENKRDLHIAIIILIVIVAGLMALGMSGEKAVHHHHWDYFSPPGHGAA